MRKTNKRGFTIVELVIVIAVIAILAAVLIPTFTNLVKKANQSADTQLVRNLNTALTVENKDYPTMHDALEVVKEAGYDVAKIAASDKDNTILWDSVNQCFVYMKKGATEPEYIPNTKEKDAQPYQLWKIYTDKTEAEDSTYSVYWNGGDLDAITVTDVGFDAGNATVASVKYTGTAANSVVIRTNSASTSLEVNAPAATVYHYGEGNLLTITAVASASYHEYGSFNKAKVAQGRIVVEQKGSIPSFEITSKDNAIKIETDKAVVVSASKAVVEALGESLLSNVEIKVTNSEAMVVVDKKVDTTKVDASGKTSEDLITITKVGTADELCAGLNNHASYIQLTADFSTTSTISIDYSMTLDGNYHTITSATGVDGGPSSKTITIVAPNIDVTLKNLTTIENNDYGYGRGVQLEEKNINLSIENCVINAKHYAINFYGGTSTEGSNNCTVTIKSSEINGWGALNIWSHGLKLNAINSTFDGYNDKVYNDAGWNGFGTIVLEGDTTNKTTNHAENCELTFKNCIISSASTTGNSQSPVLYNLHSKNNTVKFEDCEFSFGRPNALCTDNGDSNTLIIDSKVVTIGFINYVSDSEVTILSDGNAEGSFVLNYEGQLFTYNLSDASVSEWTNSEDGTKGKDYVFETVINGITYSFDFDVWCGYTGGWTLYVSYLNAG